MSTELVKHGNKKSEPIVPAKVVTAIRYLFEQPVYDLKNAAQHAGLTTRRLREALKRPHVRRFYWHEKRALLDVLCAHNPVALAKIRDESENAMAAVQSAKALETIRDTMDDTTTGPGRGGIPMHPGVTIIIEAGPGRTEQVIGPPVIEHEPAPADLYGE